MPKKYHRANVLSYNISYGATYGAAKPRMSERGFVARYCEDRPDGTVAPCRLNQFQSLLNFGRRGGAGFDLISLQEYIPWSLSAESRRRNFYKPKRLPPSGLCCYVDRPDAGLLLASDSRPGTAIKLRELFGRAAAGRIAVAVGVCQTAGFYEAILTAWSTAVFGKRVADTCINLGETNADMRPCYIALTDAGCLLVSVHYPHTQPAASLQQKVEAAAQALLARASSRRAVTHTIIALGDFNDTRGRRVLPYRINGAELLPTRKAEFPVTCCVANANKQGSLHSNHRGDYILHSSNILEKQTTSRRPGQRKRTCRRKMIVNYDGTVSRAARDEIGLSREVPFPRSDHVPLFRSLLIPCMQPTSE